MAAGDEKLVNQGVLKYYHGRATAANAATYATKEEVPTAETVVQLLADSGSVMTNADVDALFDGE